MGRETARGRDPVSEANQKPEERNQKSGLSLLVSLFWFLVSGFLGPSPARADFREFERISVSPELEQQIALIAEETLRDFADAKLARGNFSITLIDLTDPSALRRASFDGRIPYHPASVVKAFFLAAAYHEIEQRRLALDEGLTAGFRDMIVDSSNDATSYVLDRMTRTSSGGELYGRAFRKWTQKRNLMNRTFHAMGYDINANGKTWCDGIYGREKQLLGKNRENRNRITSDAVAALMRWIARGEAPSSGAMLELMKRDLASDDVQVIEFTGKGLPRDATLHSKAGWTSEVRHDATYVELANGRKYVLAVLTRGTGSNTEILPAVSAKVVRLFESP
ncbi:MAG TPA: serine hydrolase [Thermoanaerobaculia bacterium]